MSGSVVVLLCVVVLDIAIVCGQKLPSWSAPQPDPPDPSQPLGGYTRIPNTTNTEIYHGSNPNDTPGFGAYNHGSMIDYWNGQFIILWKNCRQDEDCNGQRILYSQSLDGKQWTEPQIMFRNLTTASMPAAMFVGPPIHINGRLYVAASPGPYNASHDQTAQGTQFCLWPEPINPRNCGPPGAKGIYGQENNTLMMRQVLPLSGIHGNNTGVGPVFWASDVSPVEFAAASNALSIVNVMQMDPQTQDDIHAITHNRQMTDFCDNYGSNSGTLKCEVCHGGCQDYNSVAVLDGLANERTHYYIPDHSVDVLLYRSGSHTLWASVRNLNITSVNIMNASASASVDGYAYRYGEWAAPKNTNIPNDNSNVNAGVLPDQRVYLVSNPVTPAPTTKSQRDPCTIATSVDGYVFDQIGVVMTCTDLSPTSTCAPRYAGHGKNGGPSYPQALAVVDPAPQEVQGLYVVATNNKEDVWLTHMPFSVIP